MAIVIAIVMALSIVLGAITPSVAAPAAATPAPMGIPTAAGLVVDYGNGAISYAWIPVGTETLNGIELLEQSGLPLLTVGFGGVGDGVCKIEVIGCDISACRLRLCQTAERSSPYWQYFRLSDDGSWKTRPLGGSASEVRAGDVDAWMWLGGTSDPSIPGATLDDIMAKLGVDPSQAPDGAVVQTFGGIDRLATDFPGLEYGAAGAIIATIAAIGGFGWWRSRRLRDVPDRV